MNEDFDEEPQTQKQLNTQLIRHAVDLALPLAKIGHIFKHEWVDTALGLSQGKTIADYKNYQLRRMVLINGWCELLLVKHGIHIENTRNQGYEVIDPRLTSQVVARDVKRESDKIFSQAFDKLTLATAEGLTQAEVVARHDTMAWIGAMNMMLKKQRPRPPKRPAPQAIEAAPSEE